MMKKTHGPNDVIKLINKKIILKNQLKQVKGDVAMENLLNQQINEIETKLTSRPLKKT